MKFLRRRRRAFRLSATRQDRDPARAQRRLWRLMASKTEETPQKEEMLEMEGPETLPESPLLGLSDGAVRELVRSTAGSAADALGRMFASRLSEILGQQVIFENVSGAGGMLGSNRVGKAAPDGYQFVLGGPGDRYTHELMTDLLRIYPDP